MKMPFGKYKGEEISGIDPGYLVWVITNVGTLHPAIRAEIEDSLGSRGYSSSQGYGTSQAPPPPPRPTARA